MEKKMKEFISKIGFGVAPGYMVMSYDGEIFGTASFVGSMFMCALTVVFMPWAVPMIAEFYGSNGFGIPATVSA